MIVLRTKQFGPGLNPGPALRPTGGWGMKNAIASPKTPASKPVGGWGNLKNTPSPQMQQTMGQQKASSRLAQMQQSVEMKKAVSPQRIQGGILNVSQQKSTATPPQQPSTVIPFRNGM